MLGFRLDQAQYERLSPVGTQARVTLTDYFVLTLTAALLLGMLTPRASIGRSLQPIDIAVLIILVSQVLIMRLALARLPVWFALGATLAWTCLGALCAVLALQMFVGLWLPVFRPNARIQTILLLAITICSLAVFLPFRMRGYLWRRNSLALPSMESVL